MNSPLISGAYYHIFNRGVEKRSIFQSASDYFRFLKTLDFYRVIPTPRKLSTHLRFNLEVQEPDSSQIKTVSILCFCLMPNHFHLLLQQLEEGGVSEFLRRISDSYTRYFNIKYERVGPLFQGKFKAKIIENDEYLLQLSKYIHRNPVTLPMWNTKLDEYSFSSYMGYLNPKRNSQFCDRETISNYFSQQNSKLSYKSFVEEDEGIALSEDLLIDIH